MTKHTFAYRPRNLEELKTFSYYEALNSFQFTTIILSIFLLGMVSGILVTNTNHNIFGIFQDHIKRGKIHYACTPLERQRLNMSINQKLSKVHGHIKQAS